MSTELSDVAKASARGSFFLFFGKASSTIIMALASILASQLLSTTYGLFLARKKYAVTLDARSSIRTLIASLCSTLLVYIFITLVPIPIPIFKIAAGGSLFVISFLAFAPMFRIIDREDINNLDELAKEIVPIYPITKRILNLEKKILSLVSRAFQF